MSSIMLTRRMQNKYKNKIVCRLAILELVNFVIIQHFQKRIASFVKFVKKIRREILPDEKNAE